jgi:solute carrier family 10 (sodium/bile acid cotransporter), member 7
VLLATTLSVTFGISRPAGLSRADVTVVVFCGSKKSIGSGVPMALLLFGTTAVGLIMLPLMPCHQIQLLVCSWIGGRMARDAPADGPPTATAAADP